MLSNQQKLKYYRRALQQIENGWTRGSLHDVQGVCAVGAFNKAVSGHANLTELLYGWEKEREESHELQTDFLASIRNHSLVAKFLIKIDKHDEYGSDGGINAIELWNDTRLNSKAVARAIRRRISQLEPLAEKERVANLELKIWHYRTQLKISQARVAELEARVKELENENHWLRKSKQKFTANELRSESEHMRQLDDELNAAMAELTQA